MVLTAMTTAVAAFGLMRLPTGLGVGLGTSGTRTLIYGLAANDDRTNVRGAGIAWCAGVGGSIFGNYPAGGGFGPEIIFYILASIAVLGALLTLMVPAGNGPPAGKPVATA